MASSGLRLEGRWIGEHGCLALALALWLAVAAVMMATLPALPIDETRYLTVAWEMKLSGHWLLPTLNGEPYSHKPPLFFWLINLAWAVLGSEVWVARLVSVLSTAGVLVMTYGLGRELFPSSDNRAPSLAVLLALMPVTFVYGALLMFDQLLTVFILGGLAALWRAAREPSWRPWLAFGAAIGLGLLAKGPVVLLHLLPPALLVPLWKPEGTKLTFRNWYGPILAGVAIGGAMILAWAVPAAIVGGPDYAHMIFWKQSAGRMVQSFHHRQPFWFFLPVLAGFLLPLLFWRPFWSALARARREPLDRPVRFLLCWMGPVFLAFSLISGKQPHYMLPLVPGMALVAAGLVDDRDRRPGDAWIMALPFAVLFLVLALGPPIAARIGPDSPTRFVSEGIGGFSMSLSLAAGAVAMALLLRAAGTLHAQATAMAAAGALMIATVSVQCSRSLFRYFDLAPLAAAIQPYKDGPIAVFRQYAGELGYMARLERPVTEKTRDELKTWLAENPGGTAVLRHDPGHDIEGLDVVYSAPFRTDKLFSVLRLRSE